MAALAKVIRYTSRQHCTGLFESVSVQCPPHWADPVVEPKTIIQEAKALQPGDLEKIRAVSERIQRLCDDDLGQDILLSQVKDRSALKALSNPYDRAAWVFRNEPEAFRQAEHFYFHDRNRKSRMWEGYQLTTVAVFEEHKLYGVFHDQLKAYFGNTDELLVECYDRNEEVDGQTRMFYQIMIYREGLPSMVNELGDKSLKSKIIKPVRETALTWSPDTGEVEVVSQKQEDRKKVAQLFATEVVGYPGKPDQVPLKQYCLDSLYQRPVFDVDIQDGIEAVAVTQLTFRSTLNDGSFSLSSPSRKGHEVDVYEMLHDHDLMRFLYTEDLEICAARFSVKYRPVGLASRAVARTLTFDISLPNRCNLKDRKHIEQVLNNRLLARWGLLKEVEAVAN